MLRFLWFSAGLGVVFAATWIGAHAAYHSWHPCDWLLQDTVDRVLLRHGVDPDTASIPVKARVSQALEARGLLRLRTTPLECASTWAVARIVP